MMILIDETTILNDRAIISAEYTPAKPGGIDDDGTTFERINSKLVITTTAIELGTVENYNGDIKGSASESVKHTLRADDADRVWGFLRNETGVASWEKVSK